jgi:hypothetical protein
MKATNLITPGMTGTAPLKHISSLKGITCCLSKYFLAFFLTVFLLTIVAPADASTRSSNNKHSGCRLKKVTHTYPVILTGKNKSLVFNKNQKKSRERSFSFPV